MISCQNLTFTYPDSNQPAIRGVNTKISQGSLALVVGPSGSGKSTFLRCLNGLVPHFSGGQIEGSLVVNNLNPVLESPRIMSQHVGFVFQDPEAQFVVDRVEDEIAFALENEAFPQTEMRNRVEEVLELLHLTNLRNRRLETLSGGERQRVAIAAALALKPAVLVLDEPTSQLDPGSAQDVLEILVQLNRSLNLTVLVAEHRLERILPYCNQIIAFDSSLEGVLSGPPRQVLDQIELNPPMIKLGKELVWKPLPLTLKEGITFAKEFKPSSSYLPTIHQETTLPTSLFMNFNDLEVRYGQRLVIKNLNLEVYCGEILVLMGPNGAGKTTLLRTAIGLVRPYNGTIEIKGKNINKQSVAEICRQVGYLPQDPNSLLFADSVLDELIITINNHTPIKDDNQRAVETQKSLALLTNLGLVDQAGAYPRDLSVGQRQRVALGAVTVTHPGAVFLDEPTRGLDYEAKYALIQLVKSWRSGGMAILLVTHDVELAAMVADRVALIVDGQITNCGHPAAVLRNSPVFHPQISQLFPDTEWLTVQDVLDARDA
jgi:energy-coupling factor transport system ATP-binding protein